MAVAAGYAVSSTNTGHEAGGTDGDWAMGHFEKIVDYGYRAVHETALQSKAISKAFYGGSAKHSYFNGCSNGGRQALMEAQRYPADYDGIVAVAPAHYSRTWATVSCGTDRRSMKIPPRSSPPRSWRSSKPPRSPSAMRATA